MANNLRTMWNIPACICCSLSFRGWHNCNYFSKISKALQNYIRYHYYLEMTKYLPTYQASDIIGHSCYTIHITSQKISKYYITAIFIIHYYNTNQWIETNCFQVVIMSFKDFWHQTICSKSHRILKIFFQISKQIFQTLF